MTSMANIPILSKAWLSELLFTRELFQGPTGLPLYSYQVTEEEYLSLCKLLKTNRAYAFNPIHSTYWAACFCLYVAETFRREYDASEGGWKWDIFEKRISCEFSHIERGKLVEHGLEL